MMLKQLSADTSASSNNNQYNLLSQDKKRNLITRPIILEILGRTEDNIK